MIEAGGLIKLHSHENFSVLNSFSEVDSALYYKGLPLFASVGLSQNEHNCLQKLQDGLFVDDTNILDYLQHKANTVIHVTQADRDKWDANTGYTDQALAVHTNNTTIHVTQADKDLWNAMLQNAKDYAQQLFNGVTSFSIIKCQQLPSEDIKSMTIYLLQIDPKQDDLYEEYMYIDGAWEKIGNTRVDLSDYVTSSELQSAVDTINDTITTKETAINQSISDLEDKHDQEIESLTNDIQDINDTIDDIQDIIETLDGNVSGDFTDLRNEIDQKLSELEDKHDEDIQEIYDSLNDEVVPKLHEHDNLDILDKLNVDLDENLLYDNNRLALHSELHSHANKDIIDKFSVDNNNKLLFDNSPIASQEEFTEQDLVLLMDYLWPSTESSDYLTIDNKHIVSQDDYIFVSKDGDSL